MTRIQLTNTTITDSWVLLSNSLLYFCVLLIYGAISCCELLLSVDRVDNTMTRGSANDVKGALWYLMMLLCGLYGLIIAYLLKGLPEIFVLGDFLITAVCVCGLIIMLSQYYWRLKLFPFIYPFLIDFCLF